MKNSRYLLCYQLGFPDSGRHAFGSAYCTFNDGCVTQAALEATQVKLLEGADGANQLVFTGVFKLDDVLPDSA